MSGAYALGFSFFRLPSPLWPEAVALRFQVFVHEQKVPEEMELDEYDEEAHHLLARDGFGQTVGTLRILIRGDAGKIGRVAVALPWRRKGVGREMMVRSLEYCRELGLKSVALDSQSYIVPFYEALGFVAEGGEFMDAGIPHRHMNRPL